MRDCLKLNLGSFCHLMLKARGVNWTLGVGLLIETSFAVGLSSTLIAQLTGTVPPSGVLITPPPAPVAVPPSGSLVTVERNVVRGPNSIPHFTNEAESQSVYELAGAISGARAGGMP